MPLLRNCIPKLSKPVDCGGSSGRIPAWLNGLDIRHWEMLPSYPERHNYEVVLRVVFCSFRIYQWEPCYLAVLKIPEYQGLRLTHIKLDTARHLGKN